MNKMMKPEMEVVRFGAEDVIATSGCENVGNDHIHTRNYAENFANGDFYKSVDVLNNYYKFDSLPTGMHLGELKDWTWYYKAENGSWVECAHQDDHTYLYITEYISTN